MSSNGKPTKNKDWPRPVNPSAGEQEIFLQNSLHGR